MGGTVGTILTGVFAVTWANEKYSGLVQGNVQQFLYQLLATVAAWALAIVGSLVLLKLTSLVCGGLRVSEQDEFEGLDLSQHGEAGYNFEEEFAGLANYGQESYSSPSPEAEEAALASK
jgi:ammonium transporter, Amt family